MRSDEIWSAIAEQRLAVADLLDGLAEQEWRTPSLCPDWTIRDVAAHLTLQQLGPFEAFAMMARWRGSLDRTIAHAACRRAAQWSPARIAADIRATAESRRHTFGVTYLETLTDILVHSQDIAIPLGRTISVPPAAAAVSATRLLTMRWPRPLPSARAMAGKRLVATDTDWSFGSGPPAIEAPMAQLLLLCAGRRENPLPRQR